MDIRTALGVSVSVITLISFIPYLKDLAQRRTKPHIFSWLGWTALTTVAFLAQITQGAGPGAWTTGVSASLMLVVFLTALRRGDTDITRTDWVCLLGSAVSAALWVATDSPQLSIVLFEPHRVL